MASKKPRRKSGRKSGKKTYRKKQKIGKSLNPMNDRAAIVTTFDFGTIRSNAPYGAQFSIINFDRALTLAGQFQLYKCDLVEFIYTPEFNTFQDQVGGSTVPYFYYTMNRIGELSSITSQAMLRRGAVPVKFTKPITIKYKPNTLSGSIASHNLTAPTGSPIGVANIDWYPVYDKWYTSEVLSTTSYGPPPSPATYDAAVFEPVRYYGHDFIIIQDQDATIETDVGKLTVRCHWSFKDPRTPNATNNAAIVQSTKVFQNL